MSNILSGICQKKRFGSGPIKAVVMYMADRASDDGGGIWTSKAHISADTELSKRTVQLAIKELERAGLVVAVGQRKHGSGYTIEYSLDVLRIKELPSTREKTGAGDSPRESDSPHGVQEIHVGGESDSPHGVQEIHPNHPLTIHEPSNEPPNVRDARDADQSVSLSNLPNSPLKRTAGVKGDLAEGCASAADEFELTWPHYPRKVGKGAARAAWAKARRKATFAEIAQPLGLWIRAQRGTPIDKTPHFSTWLNQERWLDEPGHGVNRTQTTADRLDGLGVAPGGASPRLELPRTFPEIEWRP